MRARILTLSALTCAAFFLVACDPPGKPKAEEAQSEDREAITDFRTLYQSNCSACHGDDGRNGPARILNDALYLSILPRETLKQIVTYGRPGTDMPAWAKSRRGPLTDKQVDILVDGMYSNWGKKTTAFADAPGYVAGGPGDPVHGKRQFLMSCFMCHGKGAKPGPITTPEYLDLVSDQMIRTSIIVGRPDLGMPTYKNLNMGRPLSNQDVTDLVAYVISLRQHPAPGEIPGLNGQQESAIGSGNSGPSSKGNEGSGNGPGSPRQQENEGNKGKESSRQRGVK